MSLASSLLQQLANPDLGREESVRIRCQLAREMEHAGNYEAAFEALEGVWSRIGERPDLTDLSRFLAAEVLLRAGSLTGWLGSVRRIEGSQEIARNLISESITLFNELHELGKSCEAQTELANCYWREGAFDEARLILHQGLPQLVGRGSPQERKALLNLSVIEQSARRPHEALRILLNAAPLFESIENYSQKAVYHYQLGNVLKTLGAAEKRIDYIDRALVEYAAASLHFGEAGDVRQRARVENSLAVLFLTGGKFAEAHERLNHARRLFESLEDKGSLAQVDETRARAFLAEGRNAEAERVARDVVRLLKEGGEPSLLAGAMTTWGTALARLELYEEARESFERARELAYQAGDNERAGVAALMLLEELSERLGHEGGLEIYALADRLLSQSAQPDVPARLRAAARKVLYKAQASRGLQSERRWPNFVYASSEMAELLKRAHRIATTTHPLLITGETGTGKELLARLVHEWSGRVGEFVPVSCEALAGGLVESKLFGHRRGSFAEADADYTGLVRQAAGGTLLLADISELSPGAQSRLLRLIEHGEVQPIGEALPEYVDVRIIAASNRDLKRLVEQGRFREDLFYRLQPFHMEIPPLRERPEDIEALAKHFITEALAQSPKRILFTPEAIDAMRELPLEGNGAQLRSLIERTLLTMGDGAAITAKEVEAASLRPRQPVSLDNPWEGFSLKEQVHRLEACFIEMALGEAKGHVSKAARLLGFKHHESLTSLLETKHRELLGIRVPATTRGRNIIRHDKLKRTEKTNRE